MKRALLLLAALFVSACNTAATIPTKAHPNGQKIDCVGLMSTKVPGIQYDYSTRNVVLAVVFSESIIVPGYVVLEGLQCPVADTTR
jgi:Na+/H+ antiporter NhaB